MLFGVPILDEEETASEDPRIPRFTPGKDSSPSRRVRKGIGGGMAVRFLTSVPYQYYKGGLAPIGEIIPKAKTPKDGIFLKNFLPYY